jgi:hypothetical protein
MSDDWQDAAFSSRHMHNSRGVKSKRSAFDVRKTFGSYSITCPAWQKLENVSSEQTASLELYRLTENREGVVGTLWLPGALEAAVILAASRKSLKRIVDGLEEEVDEDGADEGGEAEEEDDDEDDAVEQDRFETFEKNSFRSPKFWFAWNGTSGLKASSAGAERGESASEDKAETGLGYVVFAGNECRKFKGTINWARPGWKDVSIAGQKIAGRSESDVPVVWGEGHVAV